MNVWFNGVQLNGVQFTRYQAQNQNVSDKLCPIC